MLRRSQPTTILEQFLNLPLPPSNLPLLGSFFFSLGCAFATILVLLLHGSMPLVSYDIENHRLQPAANSTVAEIEESLEEAHRLFALFLMVFYIVFVFLVLGAVTLGIYICIERLVHSRRRRKNARYYGGELPGKFPKRIMEGKWFYKQSDSASTEELNSEEAYELMVAEGLAVPQEAHLRQPKSGFRENPPENSKTANDFRFIPLQQDLNAAYITDEDPEGSLYPKTPQSGGCLNG